MGMPYLFGEDKNMPELIPAEDEADAEWIPLFLDLLELEESQEEYPGWQTHFSPELDAELPPMEIPQLDPCGVPKETFFEELKRRCKEHNRLLPEDYYLHLELIGLLRSPAASFSNLLSKYIEDSGKTDPEIYQSVQLDRRKFSQIINERNYNPTRGNRNYIPPKYSAIALCFALELNLEQTEDLLCRAGYAFSPSIKKDVILKFCIQNGIDLMTANEYLSFYNQGIIPNRKKNVQTFTTNAVSVPHELEELLQKQAQEKGFRDTLFSFIDGSGRTYSDVYNEANISPQLFANIKKNPRYIPSKKMIFPFALALKLNLDQTKDLLLRAGYALSPSFESDMIISYFISNRYYRCFRGIDIWLTIYDQEALGRKWR